MTAALGFGLAPIGTSPYGIGTPAATAPLGGAPLTGTDGVRQSARSIDLGTRQYTYDATGRAKGDSPVHQMMQLVATTDVGSSAVNVMGNGIRSIKDVTPNIVQRVRSIYQAAYARLVSRGLITLNAIDVDVVPVQSGGVRVLTTIRYTDLTTGQDQEITL